MKMNSKFFTVCSLAALMASSLVAASPALAKDKEKDKANAPFKLYIRDVQTIAGGSAEIFGRITAGSVSVGDTVCVPLDTDQTVAREVTAITEFSAKLDTATTGKSVHVVVGDVEPEEVLTNDYLTTGCDSES